MDKKEIVVTGASSGISEIQWAMVYWLGTILQMAIICVVIWVLRINQIQYSKILSLLFLAIGGTSSAFWGVIVSKKSGRVCSYKRILVDFFSIKQPLRFYGLIALFLCFLFGYQLFNGKIMNGINWYNFIIFFAMAIVFGGIEEIGWRYTFQPILEKKMPFEVVSIITFLSWSAWHYLYFCLTDSILSVQHNVFLIGLLGSCFVLGAIYRVSNSLWLCVMYHCLFNAFSQTMLQNSLGFVVIGNALCILLAIFITRNPNYIRVQRV